MIKAVYQSMFVFLSVMLLAVFFVLQPTSHNEVTSFQNEVKVQFAQAANELLLRGNDISEPFAFIWSSVAAFYDETSEETLALLQPDQVFMALVMSFDQDYQSNMKLALAPMPYKAPTEEPIYNIVPMDENELLLDPYFNEDLAYLQDGGGKVLGESIDTQIQSAPETKTQPVVWSNLVDSITGDMYCVAIFNGTVNTYPGQCARDDQLSPVYEN